MIIAGIIQARIGSTRLKGKILADINGEPMLYRVYKQIENCKFLNKVIIATTFLEEDNETVKFLEKNNIEYFRGEPTNVLDRYFECAKKINADIVVRMTADNPLIDPDVIDRVIQHYTENDFDYVANNNPRTYPYGMDVEVFSFNALEKAWLKSTLPSEKEHVTGYIINNEIFKKDNVSLEEDFSNIRITVDRTRDLELIREIYSRIKDRPILFEHILRLFEDNSELFKINQKYKKDEGYLKSLEEDKEFLNNNNL
tara:strand:+ start:178 stop:945 length:768 start_codon:yes stop_codon:yes gene_type:complete